jgi:hypothetical protein|tara:strand:- start:361 stop:753 length:393 start_codon:yes stop_codon:yes gene_type:complete
MPKFGKRSRSRLSTCDSRLQNLFNEIIKYFDCSILEGHRGEKEQNEAYAKGNSKLRYPDGKHNKIPSIAVDVVPYPIDWKDRERMTYFAGFVMGIASQMDLKIRWGGDWNMNTELKDNNFDDLPHFEIRE